MEAIAVKARVAMIFSGRTVILVTMLLVLGCQSGDPAYVLFSDDGDVIAYRDSVYPTVYVADDRGAVAVGPGYAYLSPNGEYLLLVRHKINDRNYHLAGEHVTLFHIPTRRAYHTELPVDIPEFDLTVAVEDGPSLYLVVTLDNTACLMWSPGEGWKVTELPEYLQTEELEEDWGSSYAYGADELSNPLIMKPAGLKACRTVWVRPDGSAVELLRKNDAPFYVTSLVVLSPWALIPVSNGFYFMAWHGLLQSLGPGSGSYAEADLERLQQEVGAGIKHPPFSTRELRRRSPCSESKSAMQLTDE